LNGCLGIVGGGQNRAALIGDIRGVRSPGHKPDRRGRDPCIRLGAEPEGGQDKRSAGSGSDLARGEIDLPCRVVNHVEDDQVELCPGDDLGGRTAVGSHVLQVGRIKIEMHLCAVHRLLPGQDAQRQLKDLPGVDLH
jgi:hypothetical protein